MADQQMPLFQSDAITAPPPTHRNARPTELAAAENIAPVVGELRRKVELWLLDAGSRGITAKEAAAKLAAERGLHPMDSRCRNSAAPRLTELNGAGIAVATDEKRDRSLVWVHTRYAGRNG